MTGPATGYTPANHPLRDVKPDDWMLRNARDTLRNLAPIVASININSSNETRKERK